MRTVEDTITDMQSVMESWVLWAHRLEALALANPVECRCWYQNGRSGTQGHIGTCAEWREVAAATRKKSKMLPGPAARPTAGGDAEVNRGGS